MKGLICFPCFSICERIPGYKEENFIQGTWGWIEGWDDTGGICVSVGVGVTWDEGGICELGGIPSGEPSNGICVLVGGIGVPSVGGIGVPWAEGGTCELGGIPGIPSGEPSNGICVLVKGIGVTWVGGIDIPWDEGGTCELGGIPWDEGGTCELGGIPGDVSWGDPWGGANGWPSGNPSGDILTWAYMLWWSPLSTTRKIAEIPATSNKKLRYTIIILFNIFIYSLYVINIFWYNY